MIGLGLAIPQVAVRGSRQAFTTLVSGERLNSAFTVTNANGTRRNAQGLIEAVPANTPRFDYDVNGNLLGLLVEESRTNYALNSDAPANQAIDLTSAGTGDYTLSVVGSGSCAVAAGTATGTGFGSATEGSPVTFNLSAAGTITLTITGTLDYFQVEKGSFATSMIITADSAATRSADDIVCTDLGKIGFVQGIGGAYFEGRTARVSGNQVFFSINPGENEGDAFIRPLRTESANAVRQTIRDASVSDFVDPGTVANATDFKLGLAWEDLNSAAVLDGGEVATNNTATVPTGLMRFDIGSGNLTADQNSMNGHIRTLRYYPTRLPNAQLQSMTA